MIYSNPDECIDRGAREPECPVSAIFAEDEAPPPWESFKQTNTDYLLRVCTGRLMHPRDQSGGVFTPYSPVRVCR